MDDKRAFPQADPSTLAHLQELAEIGLMTSALLHEIKQPLAAIKGFAQMLRETGESPAQPIESMLAQIERMERLLANHRRLLQAGGPPSKFDLCAVAAAAARLLGPRARQVGTRIEQRLPDRPVFVQAREAQVLQILVNLVANALDAVAGCPRRAVELIVAGEDAVAEIIVADSGAGISAGIAPRVFDPFFTTKGPDSGTGLGLYISRALAEANGARLELVRPAELGLSARTAFRLAFGPDADKPKRARSVLVVDDEEVVCSMLASLLEPEGLDVHLALSGEEALRLLDQRDFDLVLSDKNLPDVSGLDIARAVRRRTPECPVILMTGYPSVETAQEGLEIGLLDYLEKPFDDIAQVRARIREALNPPPAPAAEPRPRTRRVLILEDRPDEAVRLGEAVTAAGGMPVVARSVDEALAQIVSPGADCVVLSLDLRDRSLSPEAIRTLRKSANGLIAVADTPSLEQTIAAIRMGAAACLPRALASLETLSREVLKLLEKPSG
ncbi:MAG: response regulator [Myxococcales bacterium]|jgi:DNA-binding response OmpR family regulator